MKHPITLIAQWYAAKGILYTWSFLPILKNVFKKGAFHAIAEIRSKPPSSLLKVLVTGEVFLTFLVILVFWEPNAWKFHWPRDLGGQTLGLLFIFIKSTLFFSEPIWIFMCWIIWADWSFLEEFHWGRELRYIFSLQSAFAKMLTFFRSLNRHLYLT